MGYWIEYMGGTFRMSAACAKQAHAAIVDWEVKRRREVLPRLPKQRRSGASRRINRWRAKHEKQGCLMELLREYQWEALVTEEGEVLGLEFMGSKSSNEDQVMDLLAPWVDGDAGCYIQMRGAEGEMWRYVFREGTCVRQWAEVNWKDEDPKDFVTLDELAKVLNTPGYSLADVHRALKADSAPSN